MAEQNDLAALKTDLCNLLPTSVVRLTTEDSLDSNLTLKVTHRVDLSDQNCVCSKCSGRNSFGDAVLPQGQQPSLLLSHLFFAGGEVLQKYYKVSVLVGAATVPQDVTVNSGSQSSISTSSSSSQVIELDVYERAESPLDAVIAVNSLVDPNKLRDSFSLTFWIVILTITGLIGGFGICMLIAVINEYRPEGETFALAGNALNEEVNLLFCVLFC